jgi:hypothetical protein
MLMRKGAHVVVAALHESCAFIPGSSKWSTAFLPGAITVLGTGQAATPQAEGFAAQSVTQTQHVSPGPSSRIACTSSALAVHASGRTLASSPDVKGHVAAVRIPTSCLVHGVTCARMPVTGMPCAQPSRLLHGMVSVMRAAESARDLLAAITQPVSYSELAAHLTRDYSVELFDSLSGLVLCHVDELSGG